MMPHLRKATELLQSPLAYPCVAWDAEQLSTGRAQGRGCGNSSFHHHGVSVKDDSCHFIGYTSCSNCDKISTYCDEFVIERVYTPSLGNCRRCFPYGM